MTQYFLLLFQVCHCVTVLLPARSVWVWLHSWLKWRNASPKTEVTIYTANSGLKSLKALRFWNTRWNWPQTRCMLMHLARSIEYFILPVMWVSVVVSGIPGQENIGSFLDLRPTNCSHVVHGENLLYISGDFVTVLCCNSNDIRQ